MSKISKTQHEKMHNNKLKNLRKEQNLEIDKLKQRHQENKANTRIDHKSDILNLQFQNKEKRASTIKHNEDVLNRMAENLEKVKDQTNKELQIIEHDHAQKKAGLNKVFEADFNNLRQKNALQMQDINEQSNQDLKRLQRSIQQNKDELKHASREDLAATKEMSSLKKEVKSSEYNRELAVIENKFSKDLRKRNIANKSLLQNKEKQFTEEIKKRENYHKNTFEQMGKQQNTAITDRQKNFEEKYSNQLKVNEKKLAHMIGKKDKLVKQVYTDLKKKEVLALQQREDSFYTMGKIPHQIKENKNSYDILIPINEVEAPNISVKAEGREIRISFERSHKFTINENGKKDTISKVETYNSNVPVTQIVNPKTLSKSYADGMLKFNIKFA